MKPNSCNHLRNRIAILFLLCLLISVLLYGCSCKHEWLEANCVEPKTCSKCGEKEGEPLGHKWEDSTCVEPKICTVCGETEGTALGHTWQGATCTEPKTCTMCGITEGEPIGHTPGDWVIDEGSRSMTSGTVWIRKYCQVCETQTDCELKSFTLNNGSTFLFTPKQFSERLSSIFSHLNNCTYTTSFDVMDDNTMFCGILGNKAVAAIIFNDNVCEMNGDSQDVSDIESLMVYFYTSDISEIVPAMIGVILTCDNSLEISDATDVGKELVLSSLSGEPYYKNDIGYVFGQYNGSYMLVVSLRDD